MISGKTQIFSIGKLAVFAEDGCVTSVCITDDDVDSSDKAVDNALRQLQEYFDGKRSSFDFKLKYPFGTVFQHKVWDALRNVPYGETVTYGELASLAGYDGAARAVGNAVHVNPLMIVVPCHRVVAANGIGGFAHGTEMKIELLRLEKINKEKFRCE